MNLREKHNKKIREEVNKYYGGLMHRIKVVGRSCVDCELMCTGNSPCDGIDSKKWHNRIQLAEAHGRK